MSDSPPVSSLFVALRREAGSEHPALDAALQRLSSTSNLNANSTEVTPRKTSSMYTFSAVLGDPSLPPTSFNSATTAAFNSISTLLAPSPSLLPPANSSYSSNARASPMSFARLPSSSLTPAQLLSVVSRTPSLSVPIPASTVSLTPQMSRNVSFAQPESETAPSPTTDAMPSSSIIKRSSSKSEMQSDLIALLSAANETVSAKLLTSPLVLNSLPPSPLEARIDVQPADSVTAQPVSSPPTQQRLPELSPSKSAADIFPNALSASSVFADSIVVEGQSNLSSCCQDKVDAARAEWQLELDAKLAACEAKHREEQAAIETQHENILVGIRAVMTAEFNRKHAAQLQEIEQNCAEMQANREKTAEMAAALERSQAQVAEMSVHASPEALAARAQLDQERTVEISALQSEIHKLKSRNQMYEACIEELATVRKAAARADQLAIDLKQEKSQVSALQKLIEDQKAAAIERAHENAILDEALTQARVDLETAQSNLHTLTMDMSASMSQNEVLQTRLSVLSALTAEHERSIEALKSESRVLRQSESELKFQNSSLEFDNRELQRQVAESQAQQRPTAVMFEQQTNTDVDFISTIDHQRYCDVKLREAESAWQIKLNDKDAEWQNLTAALREELQLACTQNEQSSADLDMLNARSEAALQAKSDELAHAKQQCSTLYTRIDQLTEQHRLQLQRIQTETEAERAENERALVEAMARVREDCATQADADVMRLLEESKRQRSTALKKAREEFDVELKKTITELERKHTLASSQMLSQSQQRFDELCLREDALAAAVAAEQAAADEFRLEARKANQTLSHTQQQLQQLQQQHHTLKTQLEERERELTKEKVKWELEHDSLKSKLRAADSENNELRSAHTNAMAAYTKQRDLECHRLRSEIEHLNEVVQRTEVALAAERGSPMKKR